MNPVLLFFRKTHLWILAIPFLVFLLGAASNQLVLIANHDKFPVMVNAYKASVMQIQTASAIAEQQGEDAGNLALNEGMLDDVHCVMTPSTHLNALADIFDVGDGIESIGDILIDLGFFFIPYAFPVWLFTLARSAYQAP